LLSPSPDLHGPQALSGQLVVFTGKLSSLSRKAARALVARLGGATGEEVNARTTMLVVGAEGFGPAQQDKSNKLKRAEELHIRVVTEEEFCRIGQVPTASALRQQYHALRDLLARYRCLREDHVRYLVKCGLLRPVLRSNADTFFPFPDLATVRQANEGLAGGASFRSIVRGMMASRQGQLELDFRLDAAPARVIELRRPAASGKTVSRPPRRRRRPRTIRRLRKSISGRLQSSTMATRRRWGRQRHRIEKRWSSIRIWSPRSSISPTSTTAATSSSRRRRLYERAIGLESDFFEAHFNLGNIYHDLGRFSRRRRATARRFG
jgi:hypothetical protein